MVVNNDYLVNTYFGKPDYFNLKPPMSMWAIALSYRLLGFTLEAMRIPSAIASFIMLAVAAVWLRKRQGGVSSLTFLGTMLATTVLIHGHYARCGDPDALIAVGFGPVVPWAVARCLRDGWAFLAGTVSVDVTARMAADAKGRSIQWRRHFRRWLQY